MATKYLDETGLTTLWSKIKKNDIIRLEDNGTATVGVWLAKTDLITEYSDGQLFLYKTTLNGSSTGTTLDINGLGAKAIYRYGTTKLTTHYVAGSQLLLAYNSTKGGFMVVNDYDSNSYAYVRQYSAKNAATSGTEYAILARYNLTAKAVNAFDTAYSRYTPDVTIDTSTGTLKASIVKADEMDNLNGNALVRYKATEGKNVFGGVNYPAVLMGSAERPYYSKDGADFTGAEIALASDLASKQDKLTAGNQLTITDNTIAVAEVPTFDAVQINDDSDHYQGTDNFGGSDMDTTYYSKGIAIVNADDDTQYDISYPAKDGTFALTSDVKTYTAGTNITISDDGVISSTGGGASYTAGTYITISSANAISCSFQGTESSSGTATHGATSSGTSSVAIGGNAVASAQQTTSVGVNSSATAVYCTSFGYDADATKSGCTAIGYGAKATATSATYATAVGYSAKVTTSGAAYSVAVGASSSATRPYQVSFPHLMFLTVADLTSYAYTIPTNYVCLLFSANMVMPTTVLAGATIGKGSTYTGGYLAIVFKVS